MAAPSAVAKDPWDFIVLTDKPLLATVAEALPNGKMLADAPLGIIVCGDLQRAHGNELSYLIQDCSAAIENLLLAASMLGLGACWLGVHPRPDRIAHIRKVFQLPEPVLPVAAIAIGHPAEEKESRTRFDSKLVHTNSW
jgi:nitroreductase